jgi:hypothetical protein
VLRILLLRHYLGFELDAMTVVTFTRESRKDFIKRLLQVFALWQINLQAQARAGAHLPFAHPAAGAQPAGFGQVRHSKHWATRCLPGAKPRPTATRSTCRTMPSASS